MFNSQEEREIKKRGSNGRGLARQEKRDLPPTSYGQKGSLPRRGETRVSPNVMKEGSTLFFKKEKERTEQKKENRGGKNRA